MRTRFLVLLMAFVVPALGRAAATKPPPAPAFGASGPFVKIADLARIGNPTFGPGHNIAASGSDVYVAYVSYDVRDCEAGCDTQVWLAYSLDGGATFERNILVARGPDFGTEGAQLAIGPDPTNPGGRRLHVAWGDYLNRLVLHAYAPLDPTLGSFSAPAVLNGGVPAEPWSHSLAADPLGGVHVAFAGEYPTQGTYYSRSTDGGATFGEIAQPLPAVPDGQDPAIAADAAGDAFVVARNYPGLAFWRRLAGAPGWTGPVQVEGISVDEPSIAAVDASTIHLSGLVLANGAQLPAVASTTLGGTASSDWTVRVVGSQFSAGEVKPIAVSATGAVAIAWSSGSSIYVARSTNAGATWTAAGIAMTSADARDPNLAFDAAGKILVDAGSGGRILFTREK